LYVKLQLEMRICAVKLNTVFAPAKFITSSPS